MSPKVAPRAGGPSQPVILQPWRKHKEGRCVNNNIYIAQGSKMTPSEGTPCESVTLPTPCPSLNKSGTPPRLSRILATWLAEYQDRTS